MEKISNRRSTIWTGVIILIIGFAFLIRQLPGIEYPRWLLSWPMLFIVIGSFVAFKNNFRGISWVILILLGGVFIVDDIFPSFEGNKFIWPAAIIALGIYLVFRPQRDIFNWSDGGLKSGEEPSKEDILDITSVFGGVNKVMMSKNFKGGEIVSIFGGAKVNCTQANIVDHATLEVTQIFGGTKLMVPADWEVTSDVAAIFGGIDDKRQPNPSTESPKKILKLEGVSIFGGIEITTF